MTLSRIQSISLVLVFAALLLGPPAQAKDRPPPDIENLFIFGDSLSDSGNLFALTDGFLPFTSPPYFEGRFSNGRLWVEFLALFLGIEVDFETDITEDRFAANQAVGGALTDFQNANAPLAPVVAGTGILGQIAGFAEAGGRIGRRDLVVVWGGANDYLSGLDPNPLEVVGNLKRGVTELAKLGGRFFLVPNLPNLGETPLAILENQEGPLNAVTAAHNLLLAKTMRDLERRLRVRIIVLDVNGAFEGIDEFIANITVPCIIQRIPPEEPIATEACQPFDANGVPNSTVNGGTLYFDLIHPTLQAHQLLAAYAFGVVSEADRRPTKRHKPKWWWTR